MNVDRRAVILQVALIFGCILVFTLPVTFPYIVVTLGLVSHCVLWVLDCMMGTHVLPLQPWACWTLIGGALGACLGLWTVAPALGFRRFRAFIGALPLAGILVLMIVDMTVSVAIVTGVERAAPPTPVTQPAVTQPVQQQQAFGE